MMAVSAALLVATTAVSGCEPESTDDGRPCCFISDFRGCCWAEPLYSGGEYSGIDASVCTDPSHTIPACGEFPIREGLRSVGGGGACRVLFQARTEEPCVCTPPEEGCKPICNTAEPPEAGDACSGVNLSEENPPSCAGLGPTTYQATRIAIDPDPAAGFDLDGTSASSCVEGSRARPDGPGGIDNSMGAIDPTSFNFELFERACREPIGLSLQLDANPEESCATVTVLSSGETIASAPLHLTAGCLHGRLDRFILPLPEEVIELVSARLAGTFDDAGFDNLVVGAVAARDAAERIVRAVGTGIDDWELLDIHASSGESPDTECGGVSLTLKLGGVAD